MSDLPSLEGEPAPILPRKHVRRVSGQLSSLDLGRGCPYQCSFCTIINVQGRKSRFRSPDDLERAIRENYRQGNRRFFITDDNFARNRHWEPLFDRMIQLRVGEGLKIGFTIHRFESALEWLPDAVNMARAATMRIWPIALRARPWSRARETVCRPGCRRGLRRAPRDWFVADSPPKGKGFEL
jgi:Radical SAM superfamily